MKGLTVMLGAALVGLFATFVVGMRRKSPKVLDAVRKMNRTVFNPRQMESAGTPGAYASVIRHVGRSSGRSYTTPIGAVPADDGFVIALPYGSRCDWLQNVLASGSATIVHEGSTATVDAPEVIPIESAAAYFSDDDRRAHRAFGVNECLHVRTVVGRLAAAEEDQTRSAG